MRDDSSSAHVEFPVHGVIPFLFRDVMHDSVRVTESVAVWVMYVEDQKRFAVFSFLHRRCTIREFFWVEYLFQFGKFLDECLRQQLQQFVCQRVRVY